MNSEHEQADALTQLNSALNLAKVMPPSKLKKNLIGLISLAPQIEDNLLEKVELPMEIDTSSEDHHFLKTEYNRDGDSYRSPYTNQYDQPSEGYRPTGLYRNLEQAGAVLFREYVKLYYGHDALGSFYVQESDEGDGSFSCGFFAKKNCHSEEDGFTGSWDSFNIVDIKVNGTTAHYNLQSTVLIEMDISKSGTNLSGFLKKTKEEKRELGRGLSEAEVFDHHLAAVGEMIEEQETVMVQYLEAIYVGKTKEVIFTTRWENTVGLEQHRMGLASELKKMRFGE